MAARGFFIRLSRRSKARASDIDEQTAEHNISTGCPSLLELWHAPRRCSPSLRSRSDVEPM